MQAEIAFMLPIVRCLEAATFSPRIAPMEPTIFHRIIAHELPADIVYEDDQVIAFKDIHPKATTHILFVPKEYVASIADITPETEHIPGMLILKAKEFALSQHIDGYKLIFHVGRGGGQEIFYLHLHLLSAEKLLSEVVVA